jgi:hypothetical protein
LSETLIQKISQATADGRYVQQANLQNGYHSYAPDTGSANAYAAALTPAVTSYVAGLVVDFLATHANTGASTIAVNGLSAKNITYGDGSALTANAIVSGGRYTARYDGTQFQLYRPAAKQPTLTILTSGSGTYTPPIGATRLKSRFVGGGGGGGGGGTSITSNAGAGGATSFAGVQAIGGGAGTYPSGWPVGGAGGTGGSGTATLRYPGNPGQGVGSFAIGMVAGNGGSSPFGGAGQGGNPVTTSAGGNAAANSGSGGGGATNEGGSIMGAPGGSGEYVELVITSPAAAYSYAVGAGGIAGVGSGYSGGAGGSGVIIIEEFYS